MASTPRPPSRALRALTYTAATTLLLGSTLYFVNRPRHIPGQESAAVPPPTYGAGGVFRPPLFPHVDTREGMVRRLRRSCRENGEVGGEGQEEGGVVGRVKGAWERGERVVGLGGDGSASE
ncbi:hypothetical protein EV356DRAFT_390728, partial [Viridothelium virens]